ncbi:GTP 3',8-cyclase [Gammaproteobacteria bacterium]
MVEDQRSQALLQDTFGRSIRYLRLSITERCNLRCCYCRSATGVRYQTEDDLLTTDETIRLVRLFVDLGVRRVRLTGGEPLMHRAIIALARAITALPNLEELSLSTNAILLARHAAALREAGVQRVNISLDSLNDATFATITRGGILQDALAGINAALQHGFHPVKINMVVMRGINDHEVGDMVFFAHQKGVVLRFIETMPIGEEGLEVVNRLVPADEILERIRHHFGSELHPVNKSTSGVGPARYFSLSGNGVDFGLISALSQHFCDTCNRVRLTARGALVLCLGQNDWVDLKTPLRSGWNDQELKGLLLKAIQDKPMRHHFGEVTTHHPGHYMVALGG